MTQSSDPPDPVERLKQDYIESVLSLAESFALDAIQCVEQGNEEGIRIAENNVEWFSRQAYEMIRTVEDRHSAAVLLLKWRSIRHLLEETLSERRPTLKRDSGRVAGF